MHFRQTRLRPSQGGRFFAPVHPPTRTTAAAPADPCDLPGRCFLCGCACQQANLDGSAELTCCVFCARDVDIVWERECARLELARLNDSSIRLCLRRHRRPCPGWVPMNGEPGDVSEIQRCDACGHYVFTSDIDAAAHVAALIGVTAAHPKGFG